MSEDRKFFIFVLGGRGKGVNLGVVCDDKTNKEMEFNTKEAAQKYEREAPELKGKLTKIIEFRKKFDE